MRCVIKRGKTNGNSSGLSGKTTTALYRFRSVVKTPINIKTKTNPHAALMAGALLACPHCRHFLLLSFVSDVSLRDGSCCQIWRMCFY